MQLVSAEAAANDVQQELVETKRKIKEEEEDYMPPQSEENVTTEFAELEKWQTENESLKKQLLEAEARAGAAETRADAAALKLNQYEKDLEEVKLRASQLQERFQSVEWARTSLEAEMKKMKIQAEQWRKAAEAAAAVLTPANASSDWPRAKCESMDKPVYYAISDSLWSPLTPVEADVARTEKKGGGIRLLGDFWKKTHQRSG